MTDRQGRVFAACGLLLTAAAALIGYLAASPKEPLRTERVPAATAAAPETSSAAASETAVQTHTTSGRQSGASSAPRTERTAEAVSSAEQTAETETTAASAGYYDLNRVTREELLRIPALSEQQADEILALREKLHGFLSIYELGLLDSLSGDKILHELTQYLFVENDTVLTDAP